MEGDSLESAGRLLEASGNGRTRGMTAAASRATSRWNRTRLKDDVDQEARESGRSAFVGLHIALSRC